MKLYSDSKIYEGDRHAGFASRAESGPVLAVVKWLRQGWKVIISGHSLGGAVCQLFTAQVIQCLVEIGLTMDQVVLRCVTFGTPQCADHNFWSSYASWFNVFDSYIYEKDAIFRLVSFGTELTKDLIHAFAGRIQHFTTKVIRYMIRDQGANPFGDGPDQIINVINDVFIPKYSVFGRHHFIMKKELSTLVIVAIGESSSEKQRLLEDLTNSTNSWYNYFIEQQVIPAGSLEFTYRDFLNHGCYPFAINEFFNGEVNERLGNRQLSTQILLRSPLSSTSSKSIFNLSAFIYSPNENNPYPTYIYLKGFLVDFIRFVTLPIQLEESEQLRTQKPIMTQEQSDGRAILCHRSTESNNSCDLQVPVFVNTSKPHFRTAETLDPISTVLRAYHELVLDACSTDQCNDTPLARCFSTFFDAFKLIDNDQCDEILATYLAEIQSCNYFDDTEKYLENLEIPQSVGEV
ncbi:unnamed protein product [Rotaria magnacalcarata]|uniref:Fungal lipase-type domain-containing protein n=2 Tax=Rotaria magnacalcarata TaxID=392030 RepID=A0A816MXB6_9BILA